MVRDEWQAVADALAARMTGLGLSVGNLADRSGISLTTVRELVEHRNPRRRQPRTLAALSEALGWRPGHLQDVLDHARGEAGPVALPGDDGDTEFRTMRLHLAELRTRIGSMERTEGIVTEMRRLHEQMSRRLATLDH